MQGNSTFPAGNEGARVQYMYLKLHIPIHASKHIALLTEFLLSARATLNSLEISHFLL
jgi:hypothetical protein